MITGWLLQLLSVTSFGLGNVLWKLFPVNYNVYKAIAIRSFFTSLAFGVVLLLSDYEIPSFHQLIWSAILCFVSFWGLVFFNFSIRISKASHTITIASTSSFFGVLTAMLFLNESFKYSFPVSFICIISGLVLLENKLPIRWGKGSLLAVLAAIIWGSTFALFKIPVQWMGAYAFSFLLECTVMISAAIIALIQINPHHDNHTTTNTTQLPLIFSLACTTFGGVLLYNQSILHAPVSMLSIMSASTPIVSALFSRMILHEKLEIVQYAGILLVVAGLLVLVL